MKINVIVKPGSKVEKIVSEGGDVTVWTHARAHDGEANEAVARMLAKYYGVSKGSVRIVSGGHGRHKVVEIS